MVCRAFFSTPATHSEPLSKFLNKMAPRCQPTEPLLLPLLRSYIADEALWCGSRFNDIALESLVHGVNPIQQPARSIRSTIGLLIASLTFALAVLTTRVRSFQTSYPHFKSDSQTSSRGGWHPNTHAKHLRKLGHWSSSLSRDINNSSERVQKRLAGVL